MRRSGHLLVALYAWVVTLALGATLFDDVYAAQAQGGSSSVPAEAADLLLGVSVLAIVIAIGAIAACRERRTARDLLVASLVVVMVGLLTPVLLSGIVRDAEDALGVAVGPWVRLGEGGLASMLAFLAMWERWRSG